MKFMAGAALWLAAGALAWAAPGDTTYLGTTAEGVKVKLVVAEAGNATAFRMAKTKAECDRGSLDIEAATFRRFDTSDPGEFSDKRKSRTAQSGGYLLKDTYVLEGSEDASQSSWSGTYKKTTRVFKHHRKVDKCVLSTTWAAS